MSITFTLKKGLRSSLDSSSLLEGEMAFTTDEKLVYVTDASNNKLLIGRMLQDTLVNRPTAGSEGRVFYATDTGETFFDDGTTWIKTNVTELSELNGTLDDIADGTNYQKIAADDVDASGHVTTIYDGGTPISSTDLANKADKVDSAVNGNIVTLDASGNIVDSGSAPSDFATSTDLSNKADKVIGATDGNLAGLDTSGNLTDSGVAPADKADKVTGAVDGNIANLDASGNLVDSGVNPADKTDKVTGAVDGNIATLDASGNLVDSGVNPADKTDKVTGATTGNLAGLDALGNLVDSGNKPADFIADAPSTVEFNNIIDIAKQVQVDFVVSGKLMNGKAVGDDLLQTVNKHIFKWGLSNATLLGVTSLVLIEDSVSAATINVEINGIEALSSPLSLLVTDSNGIINTSSDDVVTGNRIEITVVDVGGASDTENLTLRTVWQFV